MKTRCFLLFIITISFLVSCKDKLSPEVIISFKSPNVAKSGDDIPELGNSYNLIRHDKIGTEFRTKVNVDESGIGSIHLAINEPDEIILQPTGFSNRLRLFLSPGDSVYIEMSITDEKLFHISGDNAQAQQFLLERDEEHDKMHTTIQSMELKQFDSSLNAFYNSSLEILRDPEFIDSYGIAFIQYERLSTWAKVVNDKLDKLLAVNLFNDDAVFGLRDSLKNLNPEGDILYGYNSILPNYQYFLTSLTLSKHPEIEMDNDAIYAQTIDKLQGMGLSTFAKQWITTLLLTNIGELGLDGKLGRKYYEFIGLEDIDPIFVKSLEKYYATWHDLLTGKEAPDFTAIKSNGDTILLSQYFGKPLYIDIWASWCGPCLVEFPFSKNMMNDPDLKEMEYLFISIDFTKEDWEKGMKKHPMPGVQLFVNGAWDSEFAEKYNISTIPRYIMIDSEGNIIRTNAPRPSSIREVKEILAEADL